MQNIETEKSEKHDVTSRIDRIFIDMAKRAIENQVFEQGDYRGSDGLMYCHKCQCAKQAYVRGYLFPVACKCKEISRKNEEFFKGEQIINFSLGSQIMASTQYRELTLKNIKETSFNSRNVQIAKRYVTKFNDLIHKNQGLIFYGDVGTGKTFTASCIAGELYQSGYSVAVTSFVKLLEFANGYRDTPEYKNLCKVSLLVIDDLGAERHTDYALEKIYGFIDDRYSRRLPVIVTTNLSIEEMKSEKDMRYRRIYDRLMEICYPVKFSGPSWRKHNAAVRFDEFGMEIKDEGSF